MRYGPIELTRDDLIFSDFDGTISVVDTGLAMINALSPEAQEVAWELEYRWRRGEIDSMECLREQWGLWDRPMAELLAMVEGLQLDRDFFEFLSLVRTRGAGLAIVSDGLEFYLDRLMAREGVRTCGDDAHVRGPDCLLRFSNPVCICGESLEISFPYSDPCGQCGNCKAKHLFRLRRGFGRVIYLGDGHSDLCAARYADVIFARDALAEDCARAGRPYLPFRSFADVLAQIV